MILKLSLLTFKTNIILNFQIGFNVAETGVGPYDSRDKSNINNKAYYQWVPFMLFLQGCMFYIPHIIYKTFEGGKVKNYIDGLQAWVLDNNERSDKEHELAKNVVENIGQLKGWCLQLVAARTLYLVSTLKHVYLVANLATSGGQFSQSKGGSLGLVLVI